MFPVPRRVFLTKGVGSNKDELRSFELALRNAEIEKCNLVSVSSILPPGCRIISRNQGLKELVPGAITFAVIGRIASNEPRRLLAASIGLAIPPVTSSPIASSTISIPVRGKLLFMPKLPLAVL